MKIRTTDLEGLLVIELETFSDSRGFFRETFREDQYRDLGITDTFIQDNHSNSVPGVLRGMHFRIRRPQAQIVTVIRGHIFDVAVDVRPTSATFGRWFGTELGEGGYQQIYMAPGFAHGFCVLSDGADLHYKVSRTFDRNDEAGILWNDPDLAISWPIRNPVVSDRDANYPRLRDIRSEM